MTQDTNAPELICSGCGEYAGSHIADLLTAAEARAESAAQEARAVALREAYDAMTEALMLPDEMLPTDPRQYILALTDTPAAEALERARAEERESCAKVAESHKPTQQLLTNAGANSYWRGVDENSHSIAAAIRARGET